MLKRWCISGLMFLAASGAFAQTLTPVTQVEGISEYRLPNGLQVLLAPDDAKPSTTINITYQVGSRHEIYGETGMAHLLEHLLFKGTARHPTVWAEFTKRGLRANGSTWLDRTNYFASFAASDTNLTWYLDWLADAMTQSRIAKKDLDSEMTVVRNEMEMGENDPGRMLFEKTLATAYEWHNYGHSTIGARADVEGVDIARLQAFYRRYYQPDNATLTVSGKFDVNLVKTLITRHFGKIAKPDRVKNPLPRLYTLDAVQDGERAITLRRVGGTPQMVALYHVTPGAHPDHAAVELLTLVMGDTPSGRLHKQLTEKKLAANTWSWMPALRDPGFVAFGATLAPGQDPQAARDAMLATLESIDKQPVTAEELERARVKWLNAWEQQFTDPEQVGVAMSESIAQGDWRLFFLLRDRVKAVKLDVVQRVARERLLVANRTLGMYLPTEGPQRAPAPAHVKMAEQLTGFVPQAAAAPAERFDTAPANIDARTQRGKLAGAAAGVQTAFLPKTTRGNVVNATLTLRGGNLEAFKGQVEALDFMADMLDKGTPSINRQQVQDRLDALRTTVAFGYNASEPGALTVSIQSRRQHLPEAIELVTQLLRQPAFDPAVLDELKRQAVANIEAQRKEPDSVLQDELARHGNPYPRGDVRHARSFDERLQDIAAITPQALRDLHAKTVGASRAELAVVGDFDPAAVKSAAEKGLSGWNTPVAYTRVPQPLVAVSPKRVIFNTPDKQNANLLVVLRLALQESDADYVPLMVANYLLGQGGNSRLWRRIRETDGLSYDVRSSLNWNLYEPSSAWVGSAIFAPGNRDKVETAFKEEVNRALKDGFTAQELAEGKSALLGFRSLSRAQDGNLSAGWARNLDLNRSYARAAQVESQIQALTVEQVNAALRKYINPTQWVWGMAGDFK